MRQPVSDDGDVKSTRQPVLLRSDVCGCEHGQSLHAPRPANYPETAQSGPCTVEGCACTAFLSEDEMRGDASHSVSAETISRAARFDPSYVPPPPPPSVKEIAAKHADPKTETTTDAGEATRAAEESDQDKDARLGPLREIVKVIEKRGTSLRVQFSCGHQGSAGGRAKRGRCRVCKNAAEGKPATQARAQKTTRQPVREETSSEETTAKASATRQPVREPVRRQPVVDGDANTEPTRTSEGRGNHRDVPAGGGRVRAQGRGRAPRGRATRSQTRRDATRPRRPTPKRAAPQRAAKRPAKAVKRRKR